MNSVSMSVPASVWFSFVVSRFTNYRPNSTICLLVNLEYRKVVFTIDDILYHDTVIGADSYKTVTGGLCVAG
ncbi:unnamed protein product [Camellia sinensis]